MHEKLAVRHGTYLHIWLKEVLSVVVNMISFSLANEVCVTSFPPLATPAMPCESNNQPLCINVTLVIHCWCWLISRLFVLSLQVISKPINAYHTCAINEVSPSSCARTSALSLSLCTFHTCITDRLTLTFLCKLWVAVGFQSVIHIGNVNLTTFMGQGLNKYPASFKIKLVDGIHVWWKHEGTAPRFPPNKNKVNKIKIKQRRRPEELSWCRFSS